ncbi:MAG: thermonuclease family protein [Acidobacteriota bacterium]
MRKKAILRAILVPTILMALALAATAQSDPWKNRAVISVIDGDSIVLDNGEVVRLLGMLSPRAKHGNGKGELFGEQARNIAEDLLLGETVDMTFDPLYVADGHRDKYGRALAYVTISKNVEKVFVNLELIKRGTGFYAGPEDLIYSDMFKAAEKEARKRKAGLWEKIEKSPLELVQDASKGFEEPPASINLTFIRPNRRIDAQVVATPNIAQTEPAAPKRPSASLGMEDLRPVKEPPPNTRRTVEGVDEQTELYRLRNRQAIVSYQDGEQKLELYKATTERGKIDFRLGVKQSEKEIAFITNYKGMKELDRLLNRGTESQPTLTAVESSLGSVKGDFSTIGVSTGKDGGIVLNIANRNGSTKFYLSRQSALNLQIRIGNLRE